MEPNANLPNSPSMLVSKVGRILADFRKRDTGFIIIIIESFGSGGGQKWYIIGQTVKGLSWPKI